MFVYFDTETRSTVSIKDGTDRYMSGAQALLAQWAVDDGPVQIWECLNERQPQALTKLLYDERCVFVAHNAAFDRAVVARLLLCPMPASRWVCTLAQAYAHSLPGGLEALCAVLGVPQHLAKIADGRRLIQLFCVPHKDKFNDPKDFPEDWARFKAYGASDITSLREVHRRLPVHNFRGQNLRYHWFNCRVNERGFAVDLPLAEAAVKLLASAKVRTDHAVTAATGGSVTAVTQRDRLLRYLTEHNVELANLKKAEIERALEGDDLSPVARFILEARLEGAKASGAKYKTALRQHVDGRIRYAMQCFGAGATGRTAHKGFQPGNMPRVRARAEWIDALTLPAIHTGGGDPILVGQPNSACADALRHTIIAAPGYELVVADFANIESRVLAWLAGEQWKLDAYAARDRGEGADLYRLLYARFFGGSAGDTTDYQRQQAKVTELACGFGGSVGAVVAMSANNGADLDALPALIFPQADDRMKAKAVRAYNRAVKEGEDFALSAETFQACHVLVQIYRAANPAIDDLKHALGRAVESSIRERNVLHEVGRCKVWADDRVLIIELPSGRRLLYWHPGIAAETKVDVETGEKTERYYVVYTRYRGKQTIRQRAWAGLFVENIVQAVANDLLRYAELAVDEQWPDSIVLDIHDEIVLEVPIGSVKLEELIAVMCAERPWSRGLPTAADGWVHPRYGKRG